MSFPRDFKLSANRDLNYRSAPLIEFYWSMRVVLLRYLFTPLFVTGCSAGFPRPIFNVLSGSRHTAGKQCVFRKHTTAGGRGRSRIVFAACLSFVTFLVPDLSAAQEPPPANDTDFARVTRLADQLVGLLKNGRMTTEEWNSVATKLGGLSSEIERLLKDRPLKIHIISATYGVLGTRRTCDAKAYFRAKCEGQAKCPVPSTATPDPAPLSVTGSEVCGYDPAPLADAGANKAEVKYSCVRFGLRPWSEIDSTEKKGSTVMFVGKAQLTCDFR
jgi:hypothetical protein